MQKGKFIRGESFWRRRNAGRTGKKPVAEKLGQRAEAFG
jgi:hypothetical protein